MKFPDCAAAVIAGMLKVRVIQTLHPISTQLFVSKTLKKLSCCGISNEKGFLVLSTQVPNVNNVKSGLCPHGLPPGACPICSNMGGGGSLRVGERAQKAGEMSYHECAMIGNMMRARKLAQKNHQQNLELRTENLKNFENALIKASANLAEFAKQISGNLILKPIAIVIQIFVVPTVNSLKNITTALSNIFEKISLIKQKVFDIMDKLNAIFGELKAVIDKKVSELVSVIKTKFGDLFKILKKHNTDDEDTKIDDDKKIFNLKTILHKIKQKIKKKDNKNEQNS